MTPRERHEVDFGWLALLRWGAFSGQILTILAARTLLNAALPLPHLAAIIAAEVATHLLALWVARRRTHLPELAVVALMIIDLVGLTALLYLTGGPYNPFNFLYLVYIALGSVVLRPRWTALLAALAAALYGALFFGYVPLRFAPHARFDAMQLHVEGMWVGFVIAAAFIVYFVARVRTLLEQREAELADARQTAARAAQLAALGTLAAGAAHELGSPLATIAIAAEELELTLREDGPPQDLLDDVHLIQSEVRRCRSVLDQLAVDAGHGAGAARETTTLGALTDALLASDRYHAIPRRIDAPDTPLTTFPRLITQALRGVLDNALLASPPDAPPELRAELQAHTFTLTVTDRGPGMTPDVLERAADPFFTTRPTGRGMGLGLFLARTIIERLGGELHIDSAPTHGTTVRATLPRSPHDHP